MTRGRNYCNNNSLIQSMSGWYGKGNFFQLEQETKNNYDLKF